MAASAPKIRLALPATAIRSAPFFEGAVVFVSEPVGFKSVLVSVLVSVVVATGFVGVLSQGSKYKYRTLTDRHRETE
jgi:hypothetical protein